MYVSTVSLLRIRNNEIPSEERVPTSNLSLFNSIIIYLCLHGGLVLEVLCVESAEVAEQGAKPGPAD